jgi:hypothetical protein
MNAAALVLAALSLHAVPTPSGTGNTVVCYTLNHGLNEPAPLAIALAGSAAHSICFATWQLSNGSLALALAQAAENGVAVKVALDFTAGTASTQQQLATELKLSGGSVWNCHIPRRIENNFLEADGSYTLIGNYYYSTSAVQDGSYTESVSGYPLANSCTATFTALVSGGTLTSPEHPILPPAPTPAATAPACPTCPSCPAISNSPPAATVVPLSQVVPAARGRTWFPGKLALRACRRARPKRESFAPSPRRTATPACTAAAGCQCPAAAP